MKKIIFLFFFIYSSLSFSSIDYSGVTFNIDRHSDFPADSLIGIPDRCNDLVDSIIIGISDAGTLFAPYWNPFGHGGFFSNAYSNFSECIPLGFYETSVSFTPVGNEQYDFLRYESPIVLPNCPDGSPPSIGYRSYGLNPVLYTHTICLSDFGDFAYRGCADGEACNCPSFTSVRNRYYLIICPVFGISSTSGISEKTAITKNTLISESNSKLGSIASSNSTITNLLREIKDLLFGLSAQNFRIFGTNSDSSLSSNKEDFNSPEYEPVFSNSKIDLTTIKPIITGGKVNQCPPDFALDLAGSTYYFSYQPICDFSEKLNPVVIAVARVSAAWLVLGAL